MRYGQWGLASTLVFCSVAGMATLFAGQTYAAGECLSGPKASTPQGKHWYYRIERPSQRQCWYLGEEGRSVSQSTFSKSSTERASAKTETSPSEKLAPSKKPAPLRSTVADAHAELTNDIAVPFTTMPPFVPQPSSIPTPHSTAQPQASEVAIAANNSRFAERWPDTQAQTRVAQAEPAASPIQAPPPQLSTSRQQNASSVASTPTAPAEADDSSDMLRILLGILTAAIALAAIIGRMVLTHMRPRKRSAPRRPIWQTVDDDMAPQIHDRVSDRSLRARAEADVEQLLYALRNPEQQRVTSPAASAGHAQRPTGRSGARV